MLIHILPMKQSLHLLLQVLYPLVYFNFWTLRFKLLLRHPCQLSKLLNWARHHLQLQLPPSSQHTHIWPLTPSTKSCSNPWWAFSFQDTLDSLHWIPLQRLQLFEPMKFLFQNSRELHLSPPYLSTMLWSPYPFLLHYLLSMLKL